MPAADAIPLSDADGADAQGPCTAPLDAAVDYCRRRPGRWLPAYVLAMAPHAVLTVWLIDAAVGGRRRLVGPLCAGLLAATLWRWVVLTRLQAGVQADLRGTPPARFGRRLAAILWARLAANVLLTWGGLLLFPSFYGLLLGGFAAPLMLESDAPAAQRLRACRAWTNAAAGRLVRVTLVMSVVATVALLAAFVSQAVLAYTILPSLLGVDTADLVITLDSWPWRLRLFYFVGLALDGYWTVACVFLYYDSQSRRMATDLRVRLDALTRTAA